MAMWISLILRLPFYKASLLIEPFIFIHRLELGQLEKFRNWTNVPWFSWLLSNLVYESKRDPTQSGRTGEYYDAALLYWHGSGFLRKIIMSCWWFPVCWRIRLPIMYYETFYSNIHDRKHYKKSFHYVGIHLCQPEQVVSIG